jgi:hypothetical protein
MTRFFTLAGALVALGLATAPGHARTATWVSGKGADGGVCSFSVPCRSFAYAITQTDPGGEIDVLDSAGYGTLTIDKAISIVNDGSLAKVAVGPGATGITINAGASDAIHLRGLTIEGAGVGAIGIQFNTGGSLDIVNCVVRHLTADGIFLAPTTPSTFSINNSFVSDIVGTGIDVRPPGSAGVNGVINGTTVKNTVTGIALKGFVSTAAGPLYVTVADSVVDNNSTWGFYSSSSAGHPNTVLSLRNVSASNNDTGIVASGTAGYVLLTHSFIAAVSIAVNNSDGGQIYTFGDNAISGIAVPMKPITLQ